MTSPTPIDAGAVLDAPLLTLAGAATALRDHLGSGALAAVFLRHFGCIFCKERAAQVCARLPDFAAAATTVVFVGPGSPAHADTLASALPAAVAVLCDPGLGAFKAAGMRRSLGSTLRLRLLVNLWRARRRGFRQKEVRGDAWQQGGAIVFGADGALRHRQIDRVGGDMLDLDAVLAAARTG